MRGLCDRGSPGRARKGAAMSTEDRITASVRRHSRLRASDGDRERVLDMLKTAFVQGQLTKYEFDARVGQTLVARTFADLTAVTSDIPAWSIPQRIRKPAKTSSPPAHAIARAVACAITALSAIAIAALQGTSTTQVPRNMRVAACYAFLDWTGDTSDVSMLNRAVDDAQQARDSALAAELTHLRHAYLRYQRLSVSPQYAALRHFAANHVRAYTSRVGSGCQARDGP